MKLLPRDVTEVRPDRENAAPGADRARVMDEDPASMRDTELPAVTKGKKKKKKVKTVADSGVGSARGIETMFRTSYQAQLDMIALATTKANIMISLNGVLISVLLLSSAYLINSVPMLIVPIGSLLLTCTVAIVFAVLAARPCDRREEATLEDARDDRGVLLIFDDFGRFPVDQYIDSMMDMLRDNQRVYRNMTAHIHDMGKSANEKFSKLYFSYSTFMVGLVVSVLLLFAVVAKQVLLAG